MMSDVDILLASLKCIFAHYNDIVNGPYLSFLSKIHGVDYVDKSTFYLDMFISILENKESWADHRSLHSLANDMYLGACDIYDLKKKLKSIDDLVAKETRRVDGLKEMIAEELSHTKKNGEVKMRNLEHAKEFQCRVDDAIPFLDALNKISLFNNNVIEEIIKESEIVERNKKLVSSCKLASSTAKRNLSQLRALGFVA